MTWQLAVLLVIFIISIVISMKFSVNLGFCLYAAAFLGGSIVLGLSAEEIWSPAFPLTLFFAIMALTLFYGFGMQNGTFKWIASMIVYKCRNVPWLLAPAMYVLCFVLSAVGCPGQAVGAITAQLAYDVHKKSKLDWYAVSGVLGFAAMSGSFCAFGVFGIIIRGMLIGIGGVAPEAAISIMSQVSLMMVLFNTIFFVVVYVVRKGWRAGNMEHVEKPEPLNSQQKKTLVIIAGVILLLFIPGIINSVAPSAGMSFFTRAFNYISLALIGAALCSVLKLADERTVIKNSVPWGLLIMIAGAVTFISVLQQAGLVGMLAGILSANLPKFVIPAVFCAVATILSVFVDSTAVVVPLFIPIILGVAGGTGINPGFLLGATIVGTYFGGNAPTSTGGALALMPVNDEEDRKRFFYGMVIMAVLCGLGSSVLMLLQIGNW